MVKENNVLWFISTKTSRMSRLMITSDKEGSRVSLMSNKLSGAMHHLDEWL